MHPGTVGVGYLEEVPVSPDAILCSFPKCGRTWLRYLYLHLYGEHLAATQAPQATDRPKRIVLVRRFEDALVSYYYEVVYRSGFAETDPDRPQTRAWRRGHRRGPLGVYGALGRLPFGDAWHRRIAALRKPHSLMLLFRLSVDVFFDSYRYWLAQPGGHLLLRYEDLRADPAAGLQRLIDFLGRAPIVGVCAAIDAASFERMRALEVSGEGTRAIKREGFTLPDLTTRDADNPNALKTREGRVGGYRDHLSPRAQRIIEAYIAEHHGDVARLCGYDYRGA